MACNWDQTRKLYTQIELQLTLPPAFPEQYRDSIVKAIDLCTVKRHLHEAPTFAVKLQN